MVTTVTTRNHIPGDLVEDKTVEDQEVLLDVDDITNVHFIASMSGAYWLSEMRNGQKYLIVPDADNHILRKAVRKFMSDLMIMEAVAQKVGFYHVRQDGIRFTGCFWRKDIERHDQPKELPALPQSAFDKIRDVGLDEAWPEIEPLVVGWRAKQLPERP
ncbi:MAG TPA: hypothetical protein VK797_22865 [Tepidisphaeraceae bacterium]|jgi:hypothetical protein|nr:hypothetical protein [Tepidisphaeraceae bacterium]